MNLETTRPPTERLGRMFWKPDMSIITSNSARIATWVKAGRTTVTQDMLDAYEMRQQSNTAR